MDTNLKNYWAQKRNIIKWFVKPNSIVKNINGKNLFYDDGLVNVTYNCVRLNIERGLGNKIAIIYFDENGITNKITYYQLENLINYFINLFLKKFNLENIKKKIIAIHSSANLCSSISMLALAKLGITFTVIFNDLPKEAIRSRLKILKSQILITSCNNDDFKSKIKPIQKEYSLKILRFSKDLKKNDTFRFNNFLKKKNFVSNYNYLKIKNNNPLFVLFTSGSTGTPKGIIHSNGSYLVYCKLTCERKFGINENSIILTASDAGWINGHTYALFGPLSLGATTILIEKPIDLLMEKTLNYMLINFKINILYMPVTLIRLIRATRSKKIFYSKYLKILGSMGEPLSYNVAKWFGKAFSKKNLPIINTYFQTETGGIICSPSYKDKNLKEKYGSVGTQLTKHLKVFLDKKNSEIKIRNPWPGCMIDCLNNNNMWKEYFDKKKNFKLFDYGEMRNSKDLIVNGRIDDVINIRGHRVGSGEVESVLLKNTSIKEVCAIAVDDELESKKLVIFVSLKKKINKNQINKIITNNFGNFLKPKEIFIIKELPKTRSGKILRRILRNMYVDPLNKNLGDLSTIVNAKELTQIKKIIQYEKNR